MRGDLTARHCIKKLGNLCGVCTILDFACERAQRNSVYFTPCLCTCGAISHDTGEFRYLGYPTTVLFTVKLNHKRSCRFWLFGNFHTNTIAYCHCLQKSLILGHILCISVLGLDKNP